MPRRISTVQHREPEARNDDAPDAVDVHVGARVRLRRTLLGLSQAALGEALGLTFQQIQKYERGANRISASRLWTMAEVLDVPVSFFFDDMPGNLLQARGHPGATSADAPGASADDSVMAKRETLELVRAYYRIANPKVRRQTYDLFKALGNMSGEDGAEA
ncbi:helix-turn-helix domain-containing protein [Azospirillum soli]|uniref:helix-turn-helix domain-containing protein n=1 Tax=Azospirillum soli TaxID=1304799 RepID=UPI001AE506BF|nr:helix-turn-helix transcriptional regulator [Azospirillum soli]MBP2314390.1 transcriptional regulator with XRE-family HTH domain [Azospirillum soli]